MEKNKIYAILILILLLALLLRVLPYATGYDNLIMGDTIREYQETNFIIDNGYINYDFVYSKYPVLHLMMAETSLLTGIDTDLLFRFLPQLIASFAVIIIFLLMNQKFNTKIALTSSFLFAVFGPNILWAMKPVRETIGLFMFPLLIYMYFKAEKDKKYYIPLVLSSIVALLAHHWTFWLLLIFLGIFLLFSENQNSILLYCLSIVIAFIYYYFTLSVVSNLFGNFFMLIIAIIAILTVYLFALYLVRQINKKNIVNSTKRFVRKLTQAEIFIFTSLLTLLVIFAFLLVQSSFVYTYSIFFLSSIFLLFFLSLIGFKDSLESYPFTSLGLLLVNCVYFIFIIIGIITGYNYYDPGRFAEFLIYPNLLFASCGIFFLCSLTKYKEIKTMLYSGVLILFLVSAIFVYPTVYLGGEADSVRSYLQYIPDEGNEALEWASENSARIITDNTYVLALFDLYSNNYTSYLGYVSEYDLLAAELYSDVNIGSIGSKIYPEHIELIQSNDKVYSNGWAYLYTLSEDEYLSLYATNPYTWFWDSKRWKKKYLS